MGGVALKPCPPVTTREATLNLVVRELPGYMQKALGAMLIFPL
jgi:hypothetical protein